MNRTCLAAGALLLGSGPVLSADLPAGGQVALGAGSIGGTATDMVITQESGKLAIDWRSFDIGRNNSVTFNQPSSSAIALNRVLGGDGSTILGKLNANGQVFLVNPNGILFGRDAQVNVSGLVASTLDLSLEDFNAGRFRFHNGLEMQAGVVNLGSIVADKGGAVALLGGKVSNEGAIVANQGTVALAAGNAVTLDFAGDSLISVRIDEATRGALVENHQLIEADGGKVILSARAADTLLQDVVNNDGIIRARGLSERNGEIVLDGGPEGRVRVAGTLDASSAVGDGGFIETSGRAVSIDDQATITTAAARGSSGTWLIDPDGFTISNAGGDMTGAALTNALALGNVSIESIQGSGSDGAINVNDGVQWSANTLTLNATTNINVNNVMVASGAAGLRANYGAGSNASGVPYGLYTSQGLAGFDGRVDFTGSGGVVLNGTAYGVVINASDFAGMTENGNYVLGTGLADTFVGRTIPNFSGHLNGLGHTLVYGNAFLNPADPIGGLFGTLGDNAVVSNIGLRAGAGTINGGSPVATVGSLANVNRGSLLNTYSSVQAIVDADSIGGLVGTNYGLIARSFFTGSPVVVSSVGGGLVGINETGGRIVDSSVRGPGTVSAKVTVTVIPGSKPSEDQRIVTAAPVTYIGGLVGINKGDIKQSWTSYYLDTGREAKAADIPGFMGGGFVGLNSGTIDQSYAYRDTSSAALGGTEKALASAEFMDAVGGFVGENRGTITNAYAFDTLVGNSGASAGFAYRNSGTIANSYARYSTLTGLVTRAGFVHDNSGTLSNVYWSYSTKAGATPEPGGPGTHLTDTSADELASYGGFDPSIWGSAASGFPMLKSLSRLYIGNDIGELSLQYGDPLLGSQPGALWVAGLQAGDARDRLETALSPTLNPDYLSFGNLDVGGYNSATVLDLGSSPYTAQGYFNIAPRVLTTDRPIRDKVYDGTTAAQLADTLKGGFTNLVGAQRLGYTYSASFNDRNASPMPLGGTLTYTSLSDGINGGKASNYALPGTVAFSARINQRPLTDMNLTVGAVDKTYNGMVGAAINLATTDSVANSEIAAGVLGLGYSSAQFADKNAGTDKIVTVSGVTLLGSGASNYALATSTLTDTADIRPRPVDVFGSRAASDGPTVLDSSALSLRNVLPGDTVNLSGSATLASTDVGNHPLNLAGFGLDNPNYTLSGGFGSYLIGDVRRGVVSADASATFDTTFNPALISVSSDKAVIDWQNFNIGADEIVQFVQPHSYSIVLNRVHGSDLSTIAGTLNANGRVFILNPNGVLFAAGSSVNVAALVASTLNVTDADLKNDDYFVFAASAAAGSGSVVANGDIVIVDGGFLALAGKDVSSSGRSTVHGGTALLASVDTLVLNVNGSNSGVAGYGLGNLTGLTTANGRVDVSSTTTTGGWIETAGSSLAVNEASLDTGTLGTWSVSLPSATIGTGGTYSGSFIDSQLAKRNFLLHAMNGDLAVTDDISWSTNAQLSLLSAGTVGISARIASSGTNAGFTLSGAYLIDEGRLDFNGRQTGHSGAGVTLSGANARLTIDGDTYTLLHSMADFAGINAAGGAGHYALGQSIDAAGSGYSSAVVSVFSGTFAGLGNTIDHLKIDAGLGSNVGLIGSATRGAVIRDIGITNATVRGHSDVGVLLGSGHGVILGDSFATGTVTGTANDAVGNDSSSRLGGLIGSLDQSTLGRAHADVTVTGGFSRNGGKSTNTGGLLGFAINSVIGDSYATGDVTGSDYTGGFAGLLSSVTTQNVWASGNVRGVPGNPVTPIDANTINGASNVGGLAGSVEGLNASSSVVNARATGNVSGGSSLGGLIGSTNESVSIDHATATGNVTTEIPIFSEDAPAGIGGLVGNNRADISNSSASGDVTSNYLSRDGIVATQIGGFVGYNEGGAISGSTASGAVRGGGVMGGFVGLNSGGAIIGSSASGSVIGRAAEIGGFVGFNNPLGSSISQSTATGDVVGWNEVGGFAGANMGDITGATATGGVKSDPSGSRDGRTPGNFVGSLVGHDLGNTDATSHGSGAVGVLIPESNPGSSQTPRDAALDSAVQSAQQVATADQLSPAFRERENGQNLQGSLNASAREASAADNTEFSSSVRSIEVDGVVYQFDEPAEKETSDATPTDQPAEPDPLYDVKGGGMKLPPALQRSQDRSSQPGGR